MLTYTNKRNKIVNLQATRHAYVKFIERYKIAFPDSPLLMKDVSNQFRQIFGTTSKVKNLNRQERTRLKRHGDDTMFLRTSVFTPRTIRSSTRGPRVWSSKRASLVGLSRGLRARCCVITVCHCSVGRRCCPCW